MTKYNAQRSGQVAQISSEAESGFQVIIIGAGLGGLCLAQRLKKAGIAFTVFERDEAPSSRVQGYRLSMTADGFEAIRNNLPDDLWERVKAARAPFTGGMAFVTERLNELMFIRTPKAESEVRQFGSISRITLRDILLSNLGERVQFGKRFSHYEVLADQCVRCHFEDGSSARGQLLVGADGVNSQVRHQFQPSAERIDTGVWAISAKLPFDEIAQQDYLAPPISDSAAVIDTRPQGMFLAKHQLDSDQGGSYVFWSVGTAHAHLPADVEEMEPGRLLTLADRMTEGWHPRLKNIIRRADPTTVQLVKFRAGVRVEPWSPGPVTLLGDAIHSMPPSGGLGANTALMDASVLCASLCDFKQGRCTLVQAVGAYEKKMFHYAFPAIDESVSNLRRMTNERALSRRMGRMGMKVAGQLFLKRPATLKV